MMSSSYPIPTWLTLLVSGGAVAVAWSRSSLVFPNSRTKRVLVVGVIELLSVGLVAAGHMLQASYAAAVLGMNASPVEWVLRTATNVNSLLTNSSALAFFMFAGILPGCVAGALALFPSRPYGRIMASGTGCFLTLLAVDALQFVEAQPHPLEGFLLPGVSDLVGGMFLGVVVGLTCHNAVKHAPQLERRAASLVQTLFGSVQRRLAFLLVVWLVGLALLGVFLGQRPPKTVSYSPVGADLPQFTLHEGVRFSFSSRVGERRTLVLDLRQRSPLRLVVHGADSLLVLPRTYILGDTVLVDTASASPSNVLMKRSLSELNRGGALGHAFRNIGVNPAGDRLRPIDTLTLSPTSKPLLLSAAQPFDLGATGSAMNLDASRAVAWSGTAHDSVLFGMWGPDSLGGSVSSTPLTVFVTLVGGGAISTPLHVLEPNEPTTLVLENCRGIDFQIVGPWQPGVYVASTEAAVGRAALTPDTLGVVGSFEAWGFKYATFERVPGAILVVGATIDTIGFEHTLYSAGEGLQITFTPGERLRYEGTMGTLLVNGDRRLHTRMSDMSPMLFGVIASIASGGLAWLVVRLLTSWMSMPMRVK